MATGTPRFPARNASSKTSPISLGYENKKPITDILETPPGRFNLFNRGSNDFSSRNRLYYGENISALSLLARDREISGKIRLIYIDPPFATQTVFHSRKLTHAYDDVFECTEYLEFIRERLIFLHHLMANDGSIYVHLDAKMLFYVKILMDEIFGKENFRNCITRKKSNPKNYTKKQFGNISDYLLFYSKSSKFVWNMQTEPWTEERSREYQYTENATGRRYMKVPIHAPGVRNGETGRSWRGMMPPPGKHWQFLPSTLDELDARGEICWSKNGNPRRKVYLDKSLGISVQDIWLDYRDAYNQMIRVTGYPTEKNIGLLKRIVMASSNPGDIVLDCFAGSGTSLVAADLLGRNWIGMDNSAEAIRTILDRFSNGSKPMGDYVNVRKSHPVKELPLFFKEGRAHRSNEEIRQITDFDFFAEESSRENFSDALGYAAE